MNQSTENTHKTTHQIWPFFKNLKPKNLKPPKKTKNAKSTKSTKPENLLSWAFFFKKSFFCNADY